MIFNKPTPPPPTAESIKPIKEAQSALGDPYSSMTDILKIMQYAATTLNDPYAAMSTRRDAKASLELAIDAYKQGQIIGWYDPTLDKFYPLADVPKESESLLPLYTSRVRNDGRVIITWNKDGVRTVNGIPDHVHPTPSL